MFKERNGSRKPVGVRSFEIITHFAKPWRSTTSDYVYPALVPVLPHQGIWFHKVKSFTVIEMAYIYLKLLNGSSTERRSSNGEAK